MGRFGYLFLLLISLLILFRPLHAQIVDTSLAGIVTDSSGAVIAHATVSVISATTGTEKIATTASAGEYSFTYLTPGRYDVRISANGFASYVQKDLVLEINGDLSALLPQT